MRVSWGGKSVKLRGLAVYCVLGLTAMIGSTLYTGYRLEMAIGRDNAIMAKQHELLSTSQDRTSCMVTLTMEQRDAFRRDYRPGAFRQWCPWVGGD